MTFQYPASKRQRQPNLLLLLAGFLFLLGLALLIGFGPKQLSCTHDRNNQANCTISTSMAFGLIQAEKIAVPEVKEAVVNTEIRKITENAPDQANSERDVPVYGLVLNGKEKTLFDSYTYDRFYHQELADRLNRFLRDPNQPNLTYKTNHFTTDLFTLGSLGGAIAIVVYVGLKGRSARSKS
jgi:hypothetical protein